MCTVIGRKEFNAVALEIQRARTWADLDAETVEALEKALVIAFSSLNPRFDADRFREACTPEGPDSE